MLEYQTVGERAITRAVTGSVPAGNVSWSWRSTISRSWAASRLAVWASATCRRSASTSSFSFSFSSLASSVSPNQPNRSRTGFSALLAPLSIGASASWVPFWRACRTPPGDSPK